MAITSNHPRGCGNTHFLNRTRYAGSLREYPLPNTTRVALRAARRGQKMRRSIDPPAPLRDGAPPLMDANQIGFSFRGELVAPDCDAVLLWISPECQRRSDRKSRPVLRVSIWRVCTRSHGHCESDRSQPRF